MKIYKKLLTIQHKINGLGKDKATYNYKYVTGDKLLGEIKPMMNDLGLILKQEVLSIENTRQDYETKNGSKSEILSKVMMQFTWIDCETGETDVNLFGANGQNDWEKGLGSALTYAERYFLLKYFHIATDEDDIDNDQRKTSAPVQVKQVQPMLDIPRLETRLTACTTIDELGKVYMSFTASEKQATEVLKNELKEKLTPIK
jgi:ERF superfamily.